MGLDELPKPGRNVRWLVWSVVEGSDLGSVRDSAEKSTRDFIWTTAMDSVWFSIWSVILVSVSGSDGWGNGHEAK